jgi:TPR repeat protein
VPAHTQNPQEQQQEQAHEQQRRYVAQQKLVEQTRQQQQQLLEEQARQRKLAEANQRVSDADTQYKLGRMYYNGDGVQKDEKKAFELWQKAADQRHARAQFYLGLMYEEGWGVQQDDRKAIEWYQKAADQGDAVAKFNLGRMYANSRSAGQNESKLANQQAAQADNPQAVSSKTPNTAIEDMDIREIFEQAGKRAADREINRRVLRVVKLYANSISCGSEINSKNIAALVPYSCEIHDDDNWDDAKYAVFWEGDIGCLNLHSTERTPTYIAIVEMGGNRTFLVNPLQSSPVATWIEQDAELVGNTGDSITLEHSEYDSIDPHCCPTLWVRETYRVDKKGKWRVVNRKIKQKQVDFGDLDFSSPVDLRDVERINLGPPGEDRELTNLKAQDVLDIADASHTLIILGDGGDFVSLKNGPKATDQWVKNGQETVDGQTFDVYTNAYNPTVKILIEQTINRRVKQ